MTNKNLKNVFAKFQKPGSSPSGDAIVLIPLSANAVKGGKNGILGCNTRFSCSGSFTCNGGFSCGSFDCYGAYSAATKGSPGGSFR